MPESSRMIRTGNRARVGGKHEENGSLGRLKLSYENDIETYLKEVEREGGELNSENISE